MRRYIFFILKNLIGGQCSLQHAPRVPIHRRNTTLRSVPTAKNQELMKCINISTTVIKCISVYPTFTTAVNQPETINVKVSDQLSSSSCFAAVRIRSCCSRLLLAFIISIPNLFVGVVTCTRK